MTWNWRKAQTLYRDQFRESISENGPSVIELQPSEAQDHWKRMESQCAITGSGFLWERMRNRLWLPSPGTAIPLLKSVPLADEKVVCFVSEAQGCFEGPREEICECLLDSVMDYFYVFSDHSSLLIGETDALDGYLAGEGTKTLGTSFITHWQLHR